METIVLDGGMSRELVRLGAPFRQPEWSALALIERPDLVGAVHDDFIAAGAGVVTTDSYAVVPFHLGIERFERDGSTLARRAAEVARRSADLSTTPVEVAGCLPPPHGSYLPDEFEPESGAQIWEVLVEAQRDLVDLWLVETLSSAAEALTALALLDRIDPDRRRWVSFTLAPDGGTLLRSGEDLLDVAELVGGRVDAVLMNCAPPEQIDDAVPSLRRRLDAVGLGGMAIGAYANLFEGDTGGSPANDGLHGIRSVGPDDYADHAARWLASGASIVGGCCGVGHRHISAVAARTGG